MAIYAAAGKDGILLYTNSAQQRIYSINDCLIATPFELDKVFSKEYRNDSLDDIVTSVSDSGKEAFVAGKTIFGFQLIKINGKKRENVKNDEISFIGDKIRSISKNNKDNKDKIEDLNQKVIERRFDGILDAAGKIYTIDKPHDKSIMQFGFITKDSHNPKLLLGRGVEKPNKINNSHPAYFSFLSARQKDTDETLSNLINVLDRIKYVNEKNLSRSAGKKLTKKAGAIILSYANSNDNILSSKIAELKSSYYTKRAEKIELRTISEKLKQNFGSYVHTIKKSIANYGNEVQKELDRVFYSKKRHDIIIGLKPGISTNISQIKYEIAEELSRALSSKRYYAFQSIPFIAVPCETRDIKNVLERLKKKDSLYLGPAFSRYASAISSAEQSSGFYIPEMFISKANEMNLPILYNLKYFNKRHSKQFKEDNVLWNLKNIGADIAWKTTIGQGAKIMVIDTGIQYSHPELECRFDSDKGWNFIDDNNDPDDDNGHGTHCAGICAGADTGVAPGAGLIAGKVLDENGSGSTTDIISAIDYGINKARPDIISMSLGSRYPSNALEAICVEANRSGIIVCAAAGNEYFGPSYPAACNGVISVAAVDLNNDHAEFSNIDSSVDISCPGVDIYSTYPRNGHATLSGTSMATPGAAGCAALSVSVNSLSPEKYEKIMAETAEEICPDEPQWEEKFGSGLIRPDKIIDKLGKSYKEGNRRSHDIFTENIFNNSKECVREYKKVLSHLKNAVSFGKNISRDIGTELWRKYGR